MLRSAVTGSLLAVAGSPDARDHTVRPRGAPPPPDLRDVPASIDRIASAVLAEHRRYGARYRDTAMAISAYQTDHARLAQFRLGRSERR